MEFVARAKAVIKGIMNAEYCHSDYAKYTLHLQSCKYTNKPLLFRTEARDIYARLIEVDGRWGIHPTPTDILFGQVPTHLQPMVNASACFKIETMDQDGTYRVYTNDAYAANFISGGGILAYTKNYKIPPKLVDFVGLCDHDAHYRMWVESLLYPGQVMVFTGHAIWRHTKEMLKTRVFMSSIIVSFGQIVTVTSVCKY